MALATDFSPWSSRARPQKVIEKIPRSKKMPQSPTIPENAEEEQEQLNDVKVQADSCKRIIVDLKFARALVLPTDYELRIVDNVEREQSGTTTSIEQAQSPKSCARETNEATQPHEETKRTKTKHRNKEIWATASEVDFGLASEKREPEHTESRDPEGN